MNFTALSRTDKRGKHAFLAPSNYHWVNYTPEKLISRYENHQQAQLGVQLHEFAELAIRLKQRQPSTSATLNAFINDAIGFQLEPEVVLYYSENCFGTVDAIGYKEETETLRIHDLKTGISPTSIVQLEVYAALFCLQMALKPDTMTIVLRIYQGDEIVESIALPGVISRIMQTIRDFDRIIMSLIGV